MSTGSRVVPAWLAAVCALVVAMVVVGGVTRLTGSGLSIVEWRPVTGAVPPLTDGAWEEAFAAYRTSPQFRLVNASMSLPDFKRIFFWEYVHRLLGRVLGVVFVVPFVWFLRRRALAPRHARVLGVALALGALQGLVGWLMVKSGLVDVPRVSHYRLATHLGLALTLLGVLSWVLFDLRGDGGGASPRVRAALTLVLGLLGAQIFYGALTAGLRAGVGYNTFPTMHGRWFPVDGLALSPTWTNWVENPATVQFTHRALALALLVAVGVTAWLARRDRPAIVAATRALGVLALAQATLGVVTLVLVVPIGIAAAHQLGACVLLLAALRARHGAARRPNG
ncbi:MAG: COX15/CtaA family protein [Myxococcales bacterium]|nr:COX15/CtaA family protein [Myxococcales bacterium]